MSLITLDFFKKYARLSGDAEDEVLELLLDAAIEYGEGITNLDFTSKVKTSTFKANENCSIPASDILSVTGFYTSVTDLPTAASYFEEYRKGITINRDYPIDWYNLPTYDVTYNVTIDPAKVSKKIKLAICKVASDFYENRETSTSLANKSLSVSHRNLFASAIKISNV
jgi:hypothetical protein